MTMTKRNDLSKEERNWLKSVKSSSPAYKGYLQLDSGGGDNFSIYHHPSGVTIVRPPIFVNNGKGWSYPGHHSLDDVKNLISSKSDEQMAHGGVAYHRGDRPHRKMKK
jgi:hypothetical protein